MPDSVEAFLSRLHHPMLASIDLSLDRMRRLLLMLGSPERRLPPVIHVAGTNGKGSLLAYLQSMFAAAGFSVHRYTSPHLVRFSERIILQGKEIDHAYLETILKHVAPALASQPATFFEATTAAAFLAFSEKKADVLLMETGLGGRLDATNVIENPILTAITPVSFDHMEYLGRTLASIAGEKAGIIKKNVPCVIGRQESEARSVIEAQAEKMAAPLYRCGWEWQWHAPGVYESAARKIEFTPGLAGKHQYENAATAIACLDVLKQYTISDAHIKEGLLKAHWPARLQKLDGGNYKKLLPSDWELWLDGGHNQEGGRVLAEWMAEQKKDVHLVCGMMKNKDTAAFLSVLAPYVKSLQAVAIPAEAQSQPAAAIEAAASKAGIKAEVSASVEKALQTIAGRAQSPAIICICGSLYLAGKVLAAN